MARVYTPKQIEKYRRQKYLGVLDKSTKNLYNLFRNENSTYEKYRAKFIELKKELDKFDDVLLTTDYSKRLNNYIQSLYIKTILNDDFTSEDYNSIKSIESTNLNRLQKDKKAVKYKKSKHKKSSVEWEWFC